MTRPRDYNERLRERSREARARARQLIAELEELRRRVREDIHTGARDRMKSKQTYIHRKRK